MLKAFHFGGVNVVERHGISQPPVAVKSDDVYCLRYVEYTKQPFVIATIMIYESR